jgi:ABC-type glycerol-3-phosphate transport system substrate-binding protein
MMKRFALPKLLLLCFLLIVSVPVFSAAQEPEETVTLVQLDSMGAQTLAFDEAINIFEEQHPNIKIDRQVSPAAAEDILLTLQFGSPQPDIVNIASHESVLQMMELGEPLMPLNRFPDFEAFKATIPDLAGTPLFLEGLNVFNGDTVSLPFERFLPLWHLFVNTALYREAGIVDENGDPLLPETLDEFFQNSLTIHRETGAYGFSSDSETFHNFLQLCTFSLQEMEGVMFGYKPYLGRSNWSGEPCYQELFAGFQTLWNAGAIPPDHLEQSYRVMRERFVHGEVAHILDGVWATSSYLAIDPAFQDYMLVRKPLAQGLDEPISYEGRASIANPLFLGINAHSPHPEEAWEWIKFVHSAEFAEIWLKYEFGVSIYLATDPSELPLSPIFQNYLAQSDLIRMASPLELPPIQVFPQLFGPTHLEITHAILSGELPDFQTALLDYDKRVDDAINLAFAENQQLGVDISPATYTDQDYRWLDPVPLLPTNR